MPQLAYRFKERLAAGGTGEVYRGELVGEAGFTRPVAIKLLRADVEHRAELEARLRDEARMVARLRHPSVVRMENLCSLDGRVAVVMEYVDGVDLATARDGYGPFPPRAVAEVLYCVAGALREAWLAPGPDGQPMHIVHRDIKPENIALDRFGEVKVLDFGAARARFAGREAQTRELVPGTLRYMAPERFAADTESFLGTPASDLWALGATGVELALGARWSKVRQRDPNASPQANAQGALREASTPGDLAALLLALLDADPGARPTVDALLERATALAEELPGASLRTLGPKVVAAARGPAVGTRDARFDRTFTISGVLAPEPGTEHHAGALPLPVLGEPGSEQTLALPAPAPVHPRRARGLPALAALGAVLAAVGLGRALLGAGGGDPPPEGLPVASEAAPPSEGAQPTAPALDAVARQASEAPRDPQPTQPRPPAPSPSLKEAAPPAPPAPAPEPPAEPPPPTPRPAAPSPVLVAVRAELYDGVEAVWLVDGQGWTRPLPGQVPAGTYAVWTRQEGMERQAPTRLTVAEGQPLTLRCSARDCRGVRD